MVNKYNLSTSARHLKDENVRRTYTMVKCKNWRIKSLQDNKMIIDADYYNNESNEGEIFFQLINLTPFEILLRKGTPIGQGIIKSYLITEDDSAEGERTGGFGSTDG